MNRLVDNALVRVAGKLALTAGVLATVAAAIVVAGESELVSESRADILDFSGAADDQRSFRNALDALGHEEAQTYVVNGNEVRVSTAAFEVAPRRALRAYQRQFVRHGLNDRRYNEISHTNAVQRMRASTTGGVVPAVISPDRVVMRGAMMEGEVDNYEALFSRRFGGSGSSGIAQLFDGFRWVELHRNPGGGGSTAVAMWSGEDFDYDRMFPDELEARLERADLDLPPCPNCQLVHQFTDPDRRERSTNYLFVSERSPESLGRFFESHCGGRSDTARADPGQMLDQLRRRVDRSALEMRRIRCTRGGRYFTLRLYPTADDRTAVRIERRREPPSTDSPSPK